MTTEQTPQWTPPKNWRWWRGMTAIDRDTGDRGIVVWVGVDTLSLMRPGAMRPRPVSIADLIPDFSDPATLGCLLALVREAWGDEGISTVRAYAPDMCGQWAVHSYRGGKQLPHKRYPTEAEALLAALEAAP